MKKLLLLYTLVTLGLFFNNLTLQAQRKAPRPSNTDILIQKLTKAESLRQPKAADTLARQLYTLSLGRRDFKGTMIAMQAISAAQSAIHRESPREVFVLVEDTAKLPWLRSEERALVRAYQSRLYARARNPYGYRDERETPSTLEQDTLYPARWATYAIREHEDKLIRLALTDLSSLSQKSPLTIDPDLRAKSLDRTGSYAQEIFHLIRADYEKPLNTNTYILSRLHEYSKTLPIGIERFWAEYKYISDAALFLERYAPKSVYRDMLERYAKLLIPVNDLEHLLSVVYDDPRQFLAELDKFSVRYRVPGLASEREGIKRFRDALLRPEFRVSAASGYVVGPLNLDLYLTHRLYDSCQIRIYKASPLRSGRFPKPEELQLVSEQTHRLSLNPKWDTLVDTLTLEFPQTGCYYLQIRTTASKEARGQRRFTTWRPYYMPIQVTRKFAVNHLPNSDEDYEVQWFDAVSGKPLEGEKLELYFEEQAPIQLSTDRYGLSRIAWSQLKSSEKPQQGSWRRERFFRLQSLDPNDAVEFGNSWIDHPSEVPDFNLKGFLSTDRGLYRPGDKIHFFGYAVSEGTSVHDHKVFANKELSLTCEAPNREKVFKVNVTTDSWGRFSYSHEAPSKLPKGMYAVELSYGKETITTYRMRVEEYKAPSFSFSMTLPQEVALDSLVSIPVRVLDLTGAPLAGVRFQPIVSGVRRIRIVSAPSRSRSAEFLRMSLNIAELSIEPTNAAGETVLYFRHQVPELPTEYRDLQLRIDEAIYAIKLQATGATGESVTQEETLNLPIGLPERMQIGVDQYINLDNDRHKLCFSVLEMNRDRDHKYPITYILSTADSIQHTAQVTSTDSITLKNIWGHIPSGRYTLAATAEIAPQHIIRERQELVLYRSEDKKIAIEHKKDSGEKKDEILWAQYDKETFNEQEPPRVFLASSLADTYVSYRISVDGRLVDKGGLKIGAGELHRISAPVTRNSTNALMEVYAVRFGKLISHRFTFQYQPSVPRKLELRWESFRDRIASGSQEEWRLRILNDGKPVEASLAAWMFDDALNQISPQDINLPNLVSRVKPNGMNLGRPYQDNHAPHILAPDLFPRERFYDNFETFIDLTDKEHLKFYGSLSELERARSKLTLYDEILVTSVAEEKARRPERTGYMKQMSDDMIVSVGGISARSNAPRKPIAMRENLTPLAFCRPMMQTDKQGQVSWSFKLPDVLTRWRLELVAHTTDARSGYLNQYVESYRELMVRPFLPRQLRVGDRASLSAQVHNASSKIQRGEFVCELFRLDSQEVLQTERQVFSLEPNRGESFSLEFDVPKGLDALGVRLVAKTDKFSDGEQHALAILPATEPTTQSQAFTLTQAGTETISLDALYPTGDFRPRESTMALRVESNPLFLALEALPPLSEPWSASALSLSTAIYARALAGHLAQMPGLRGWVEERSRALGMPLRQDRNELLATPIEQTPWLHSLRADKRREAELLQFLSKPSDTTKLDAFMSQLIELQTPDGHWSWFPGMRGSYYITSSVVPLLLRARPYLQDGKMTKALDRAIAKGGKAITKEMSKVLAEWRKVSNKPNNSTQIYLASIALDYLYMLELDTQNLLSGSRGMQATLLAELNKLAHQLPLYDKARAAIVLRRTSPKTAKLLLESLRQHLSTGEVGDFFAQISSAYGYWWRNRCYPLTTEFIEALHLIDPQDQKTIKALRAWLLNQRRSARWESDLASVEAIQALLRGSGAKVLQQANRTDARIELSSGKTISAEGERIGLSQELKGGEHPVRLVVKTIQDEQMWGSVTLKYEAPIEMLGASGRELRLERKHFIQRHETGKNILVPLKEGTPLHVGDVVVTQIYLVLSRDMDFVSLSDPRLGCTEPTKQTSGMLYSGGTPYYYEPRDKATNFYFDSLDRGEYRLEYKQFVVRAGLYQAPSAQAQSTYAPEYTATSGFGGKLLVKPQAK